MQRRPLHSAPKARVGDAVAILSPAFAAPAISAAVHDQAKRRLTEATGLVPVEYPTTRQLGASPEARAADLNDAFADPSIRAVLATVGGDDQITVIPHIKPEVLANNPKPFLGCSDNSNLHTLLWNLGIASFYGGSTQVHLGAGPHIDEVHARSLRAALISGETLELTEPGEAEDFGVDWADERSLTEFGSREATEPWSWAGPRAIAEGPSWGGCIDVIDQIAMAGRLPDVAAFEGTILLIETSEVLPPADWVNRWVRSLGERGILAAVAGVMVARPPVSALGQVVPDRAARAELRAAQRDVIFEQVNRYNPAAVVCFGVPFGHTRPQWIVPHGGTIQLDGITQSVFADYS